MKNRYTDAFARLEAPLAKVAARYGVSKLKLYIDAAKCFIRYGVTPNQYLGWRFYELSHFERSQFYTYRHSKKWEHRFNNQAFADFFNQKQQTNKLFSDFIKRNWLYTRESSEEDIQKFLHTHSKVIVKPVGLSSGRGIHVARNEKPIDLKNEDCLLEEFIVQHEKMSQLNPSSVNSVRIYTLSSRSLSEDGKPEVIFLSASIRVGGADAEVDNYHSGGVGYPLDLETGTVNKPGVTISGEEVIFHPGSGVKMVGFQVPNWKKLKSFVIGLDRVVPEARLIAWDLAVLEDGFELIEANYDGCPGFMQAPSQIGMKNIIIKNF